MKLRYKILIVIGVSILVTILNYFVLLLAFSVYFPERGFDHNNWSSLNVMVPITTVYIVVLIVTIFIFIQYENNKKKTFSKYKELKRESIHANKVNEKFFDIVSKGKRLVFRFNLTKDLILEDDIVDNKNGKSILKAFSLPNKCSFSELLKKINSYVIVDDKHIKKFTYDEIVKGYISNNEMCTYKVKTIDIEGNEIITNNEISFYKENDGDVLGIFICEDVTSENKMLIKQVNYVQNMDKSISTVLSYTYIRVLKVYLDFNSLVLIYDADNNYDPYEMLDCEKVKTSALNKIPFPYNKTIKQFLDFDNIINGFENNKFLISSNYKYDNKYHRLGIVYSYEDDKRVAHVLVKDVSSEVEDMNRQKELSIKLSESMEKESQYLESLLSRSCLHFDINLTKNKITSHSKFILEDKEIHFFDEVNNDSSFD